MPDRTLRTEPLTREAFAPFGQVIESEGAHHYPINGGNCERYHDLAKVELGGAHARPMISLLRSRGFELPYTLTLVRSAARPSILCRTIRSSSLSPRTKAALPAHRAPFSPSQVRA